MRTLLLTAALLCLGASVASAAIPLVDPPQTLKDADGNPEIGLVDPFTPRSEGAVEELGEAGLVRTSLGDLPAEFRLLAIVIPEGEDKKPSALIRMSDDEAPTLVQEGDQIRVIKGDKKTRRAPRAKAAEEDDRFIFYLYVKTIAPTYLEVYHSKKRPDETLILSW